MFIAAYRRTLQVGELDKKVSILSGRLSNCDICPRKCGADRTAGQVGFCGMGERVWISSYGPHYGEEDPLKGTNGSGTIFFSGCNLACLYCQNADISQRLIGSEISIRELGDLMLQLQGKGCHNINLVSPTHVVPQVAGAICLAAKDGLTIPIVYNSGGYDSLQTLKILEGVIDIYLPDMKYSDEITGRKYSGIPAYPAVNQAAVLEMHRQVGDLQLSPGDIAERGIIIRHLVLPNGLAGSQATLRFIADQISTDTYLNIMDQYHPAYLASTKEEINRRLRREEYLEIIQFAKRLGLTRLDRKY